MFKMVPPAPHFIYMDRGGNKQRKKGFFRLRKAFSAVGNLIFLNAGKCLLAAFSLDVITKKSVNRYVKEVCKLEDKAYIRNGKLCFPLINRSRCYAEGFRKLLLSKPVLFSE